MKKVKFILAVLLVMTLAFAANPDVATSQTKINEQVNSGGYEYSFSLTNIDSASTATYTTGWADIAHWKGQTKYITYQLTGDAAYRVDTLLMIIQGRSEFLPLMVQDVDTITIIKDTIRVGVVKVATQVAFAPYAYFPQYRAIIKPVGVNDDIARLDVLLTTEGINTFSDKRKFTQK